MSIMKHHKLNNKQTYVLITIYQHEINVVCVVYLTTSAILCVSKIFICVAAIITSFSFWNPLIIYSFIYNILLGKISFFC